MNLGLAMFIFDIGICLRISAAWLWFFAGGIIPVQLLYILANISILIGFFCKIRALTEPDYGPRPWLVVMILTSLASYFLNEQISQAKFGGVCLVLRIPEFGLPFFVLALFFLLVSERAEKRVLL